jgi:DNA-binding NarL/FixJ family response regulator
VETEIRVLIADDTAIAREGLRRLLESARDITIIAEAENIYEAVQLTGDLRPDVVLMDLKWFGDESAGISAIEYLHEEVPECKIIAITVYEHLIRPAREAGAHLAVTKEFSRVQLHEHIRSIYRTETLPPARPAPTQKDPIINHLTAREQEVLELMAEGHTDQDIARQLVITTNTVKKHVASVLDKLNARNRTQAVIIALRKGLLERS